jgi:hypothetical protein
LAGGVDAEVLSFLDDHSRLLVACRAFSAVTVSAVVETFVEAVAVFGVPASTLTDNGLVFTARFAGGRGGRNRFEVLLAALGVKQKNGAPSHPQTQGKVERFQQTLKKWLRADGPARDAAALQTALDEFRDHYNNRRPHRALRGAVPAEAYAARPKAEPAGSGAGPHWRVRTDKVDKTGKVTLRVASKLLHIGLGRAWASTPVVLIVKDLHVRVVAAATGELIRELEIDPTRSYQPQTPPPKRQP